MRSLYLVIILVFPLSVQASSAKEERERIKKLDDRSLQVRTEKIKTVQQQKIETCVKVDKQDRAYCERFFRDYGWGSRTSSGNRNVRLFDQIPECVEAFEARKNRKH